MGYGHIKEHFEFGVQFLGLINKQIVFMVLFLKLFCLKYSSCVLQLQGTP